jgi:type VI secretion system ImpM family protein
MAFTFFKKTVSRPCIELGFYGKLPRFSDFVHFFATSEEARALFDWFEEGLAALEKRPHAEILEDYAGSPSVQFLFHPPASQGPQRTLVGAFRASTDRSGRRYPFAVFALLSPEFASRWMQAAPWVWREFLEAAESMLDRAAATRSMSDLTDLITELPAPKEFAAEAAEADYGRFLRDTRTDRLLFGAVGNARDARHVAARRLYQLCETSRGSRPGDSPLALRARLLPPKPALSAAFYVELCFRLLDWKAPRATAFWTAHADRPYLLFLLGRPTGRTFLHLLRDDIPDEALCDLSAPPRPGSSSASALPLCATPPLTLLEVLGQAAPQTISAGRVGL